MARLIDYFACLRTGKAVLWCYLIWYLVTVALRFDPAPSIWLNALGISVVIGLALRLSVAPSSDPWQMRRLFIMPFGVSSFSSLIKGHGYLLIFPPDLRETLLGLGCCALFVLALAALKRLRRPRFVQPLP